MALLEILKAPDPRLKHVASPVQDVDRSVRQTITNMLETMYDARGCGLAATQCGLDMRVVVIDFPETHDHPAYLLKMVNPKITWKSPQKEKDIEGCLSVPDFQESVKRSCAVDVSYYDENNEQQLLKAQGYFARCLQHELDHLDGILYIDHLKALKREKMLKVLSAKQNAPRYKIF